MHRYLLIAAVLILCLNNAMAQDPAQIHHKRKLLKGQWQLVKTYNNGVPHSIAKDEYDAVITFKSCHKYTEEVKYEGYHWIIRGRWKVYRHKDALELTKPEYISGTPPGAVPQDIHFTLYQLDKGHWGGNTVTKAEKVKMEYERIHPQIH